MFAVARVLALVGVFAEVFAEVAMLAGVLARGAVGMFDAVGVFGAGLVPLA